jgi:hypothetical protein
MKPVMIHADGTGCHHEGPPKSAVHDGEGPRCAGGLLVTHVRFNGRTLTVEEAAAALQSVASAFAAAFIPLMESLSAAFVNFGRQVRDDPRLRVLAATLSSAEAEAAAELADTTGDRQ